MQDPQETPPNDGNPSEPRSRIVSLLIALTTTKVMIGAFILFCVGVLLVAFSFSPVLQQFNALTTYIIKEIGTGLLVTAVATGFLRLLIVRSYNRFEGEITGFLRKDVTNELKEIQKNIAGQTERLIDISASLEAMNRAGIYRLYLKRNDASRDIAKDLEDPKITQLCLIGISLNDFVRGDNTGFHEVWRVIEGYIQGDRPLPKRDGQLDIKVLIIDPNCQGAQLRSRGEIRQRATLPERLYSDVQQTARYLFELEKIAKTKCHDTHVSFKFRLYQLPPHMFILRTDTVSYIEPYYFWASRAVGASFPVIKCGDVEDSKLHRGMQEHFNLIWEKASISSTEFMEEHDLGIDRGILQSGAINVFSDPNEARERILWLLNNTKTRMYIQGISLHSFFEFGSLYTAIQRLAERDNMDIKILLLNPNSEQAYYRSFREYLLKKPASTITFEQFRQLPDYRMSRLYRETLESIEQIEAIEKQNSKIKVMLYDSAPSCFVLLVDDSALVEQYHYGKIVQQDPVVGSPILGKDMALFEYARKPTRLFEPDSPRNSLELLESHFDFVFEKCSQPVHSALGIPVPD